MSALTSIQKAQLHEVADGMLNIYQTLVRMRYLDAAWICEGPHELADHELYKSLGLDASIIYLYSILPYIDSHDPAAPRDFYDGSYFADFRNAEDVEESREPSYNDEQLCRPWQTSLNRMVNHGGVLVYDARKHTIAMADQTSDGSTDPNFQKREEDHDQSQGPNVQAIEASQEHSNDHPQQEEGQPPATAQDIEATVSQEQDERSDADQDDWIDDGEDSHEEENYWAEIGRNANFVLRDIKSWYEDLTETPGGGEHTCGVWDEEIVQPLYIKHGWPSADFDGNAFVVDHLRAVARKDTASRLNRSHVKSYWNKNKRSTTDHKFSSLIDRTTKDEWLRKLYAIHDEYQEEKRARQSQEDEETLARLTRYNDEGLQLPQEYEVILERISWAHGTVKAITDETLTKKKAGSSKEESERIQTRLQYAQEQASICDRAHDACKRELFDLDPGTYHKAFLRALVASIEVSERWRQALAGFISELPPSGAEEAMSLALKWTTSCEEHLGQQNAGLARLRELVGDETVEQIG